MPHRTRRRPDTARARRARFVLCAAAASLVAAVPSAWAQATSEQIGVAECADASAPTAGAGDTALRATRPSGCEPPGRERAGNTHSGDVVLPPTEHGEAETGPRHGRPSRDAKRTRPHRPAKRRRPQRPSTPPAPQPSSVEPDPLTTFHTPLVLLPLYQAAGAAHGVPWEVLAAINEVETAYGDTLAVSSAGAQGWMQFMPQTWRQYGVDADRDGAANPNAPADAIFAAARYLQAAGASTDLRGAIFAYNHADWYVDKVLALAARIAAMPDAVVSSLSGLATAGPPVVGPTEPGTLTADGSIALRVTPRAPAIAVADGVVERLGRSPTLGSYLVLRDDAGNGYVYSRLGSLARAYTPPAGARVSGQQRSAPLRVPARHRGRLYAHPTRRAAWRAGGFGQLLATGVPMRAHLTARGAMEVAPPAPARDVRRLRPGARVSAGTVLASAPRGRAARTAQIRFAVQPAGPDAAAVDPRPLLRAWAVMRRSGAYRALDPVAAAQPGAGARTPTAVLERRVLDDPDVRIYPCGREDIGAGRIDARVLATLARMADAGLRPTVTSLECGHSVLTRGGRISEHISGNAVDIAAVNGVPVVGHQEPGGIVERTVRWLLAQPGELSPHQVISLLSLGGASFAQPDHADHIHVGFRPRPGTGDRSPASISSTSSDDQELPSAAAWQTLLGRVEALPRAGMAGDPTVPHGDSPVGARRAAPVRDR